MPPARRRLSPPPLRREPSNLEKLTLLKGLTPEQLNDNDVDLIVSCLRDGHTQSGKYKDDWKVREEAAKMLPNLSEETLAQHAPQLAYCLTLKESEVRDKAVVAALERMEPTCLAESVPELIQHKRHYLREAVRLAEHVFRHVQADTLAKRFRDHKNYGERAFEQLSKHEEYKTLLAEVVAIDRAVGSLEFEGKLVVDHAAPPCREAMRAKLKSWKDHAKELIPRPRDVLGMVKHYLLPASALGWLFAPIRDIGCEWSPTLVALISNCSASE